MKRRSLRMVAVLATHVAVLSCGGADGIAPRMSAITRSSDSTLVAGLYASGPVAGGYLSLDRIAASGSTASGSAAASAEVSWVSLVPGTVPDGTTATIINLRTAQRVTAMIVDGGFDPEAIPAILGDTLQISVSRVGKADAAAVMSVVARPGPRIVRSRPPRGQTDAPLNTIITLVFSEPLDPASVNTSSVTLTTANSPVAGQVRILPGPGYIVEFTPDTLLAPLTTYALTVSGVASLAGTPLAAPTSINFATSGSASSDPAIAFSGQAVREIPVSSHFWTRGLVSSRNEMLPTSWRSRDPSIATVDSDSLESNYCGATLKQQCNWGGRVVGIRPGTTVIEASSPGGATDTIAVTVLAPAPASAVSPVVVDFRLLEMRYTPSGWWAYAPDLVLRDTTGRGGSAIIGLTFDVPGLPMSPTCVMLRAIGSGPLAVGYEDNTGGFVSTIGGNSVRANGTEAVAHVTLRIPGPAAMTIDVRGPIVPSSVPTVSGGKPADVMSCGW